MPIQRKRVVEPPSDSDGYRVLVDRVWPRGISKERAALDRWMKEIAPSTPLRKWFGHVPERFEEFRERYLEELSTPPARELLDELVERSSRERVTLLYGAKDELHNQARVLEEEIRRRSSPGA